MYLYRMQRDKRSYQQPSMLQSAENAWAEGLNHSSYTLLPRYFLPFSKTIQNLQLFSCPIDFTHPSSYSTLNFLKLAINVTSYSQTCFNILKYSKTFAALIAQACQSKDEALLCHPSALFSSPMLLFLGACHGLFR
jgi:hypothetical protein